MKWATRQRVHIDRAACAWLILRFVDLDARFMFVADPADVPRDATPFDMPGVELSHHGGDCTFETLLRRHDLTDPVLWRVAALVHAIVARRQVEGLLLRPSWSSSAATVST